MVKKTCMAFIIIFMFVSVASARVYEDVEMPELIDVGPDKLVLNGVGMRKLFVLEVYIGALYLPSGETDAQKIIMADEPQAIRLQMLRGMGAKTMNRALYNGMRTTAGAKFKDIEDRTKQFEGYLFDELEEEDIFEFRYVPAFGVQVWKNGEKRGTIAGLDFKQAFFGIWLNDTKPADEDLKEAMLAGDVSAEANSWLAKKQIEASKQMFAAKKVEKAKKAKAAAAEKAKTVAKTKKVEEAKKVAKKLAPKKPAKKPVAKKAPAMVSAAGGVQVGASNALISVLLVNLIKTSELNALQKGEPFDVEKETENVLDMWDTINKRVSDMQ